MENLCRLFQEKVLTPDDTKALSQSILTEEKQEELLAKGTRISHMPSKKELVFV
jgi:hypothetical protein